MPKMIFSVGGSAGLNWSDFVEIAQACEEMGFYAFYGSDHLMTVQQGRSVKDDRLDAPSVMLALCGYTSKIRLGVQVIGNLFRHPAITAKMFNTLDHASGGRADLGLGAGWAKGEHAAHGMPFPPLAERLERLEESLTIIRSLFTQDRTTFEGKHYQLHDVPFDPKPVQKPHPPIQVGGVHPETLRSVARHADDWSSLGPLKDIAGKVELLKEVCKEEGRDFSTIRCSHQVPMLLTGDRAAVEKLVEAQKNRMMGNPGFRPSPNYPDVDAQIRDTVVAGDVEDVKAGLERWRETGVTHMNVVTPRPFNRGMLEEFMAKVAPAFA